MVGGDSFDSFDNAPSVLLRTSRDKFAQDTRKEMSSFRHLASTSFVLTNNAAIDYKPFKISHNDAGEYMSGRI